MKKIVVSVGMVALGAASVQAQYAPGLTPQEMAKPWALSASLRGFYDDNYLTLPATYPVVTSSGAVVYQHPASTYGFEFTPSAAFNHSVEDTLVSASYIYDVKYYLDGDHTDQSHQLNGRFEHQFSENYKLAVSDSFIIAQDPAILAGGQAIFGTPLRTTGNNVHNIGTIDFNAALTKELDLHLGYANNLYAYRQVGGDEQPTPYSYASRSAALDRIEQLGTIDLRWKFQPDTTGVLGYQYGNTDYTSPEYIIYPSVNSSGTVIPGYVSKTRNSDQDFVYVGADHSFTDTMNGSIRLGGEYLDYYNLNPSTTKGSPYVDLSLTDQYMPRCSAQVGVKHEHSSTDVTGIVAGTSPVLDSDTTAAYCSVNHSLSEKMTASLLGQAQFSSFNGGGPTYNGHGEAFFIAALNVSYHINEFLLTEAGYNYSKLNSDLQFRSYTRDFLYIGLRATY
jgi:hypothetical protein